MTIQKLFPHDYDLFKTFPVTQTDLVFEVESRDGDLSLLRDLPEKGLAIVGARYPQRRSLTLLESTIEQLRNSDLVVISGLARGIDSKAHELALDHGLKTIGILGCGLGIQYPRENAHLRKRILENGGLVLSPFESTEPALPHHFLDRNQYIAAFSKAVWVVEAAAISGTLNTAKWAAEFNRDLYATPCFPGDHFYHGNEKLLSERATHRHPVAHAFFNAHSLQETWPHLLDENLRFNLNPAIPPGKQTCIQRWVLEIKSEFGECHVQALMNHASKHKFTLGEFYLTYEKELGEGKLVQDQHGRVDLPG